MTETLPTIPKTVLLLGGSGFVGINLAFNLQQAGHRVLSASGKTNKQTALSLPLEGIGEILELVRKEKVDVVVHLASSMVPSSTMSDYIAERDAVTLPTLQIGVGLAELGVGLLYLSSGGTVYGKGCQKTANEENFCEPISWYGHAKLELENGLSFLRRTQGLRCLIVRPSNPYGPHQPLRSKQGLISVIFGKIMDRSPLEIWGDGSSIRDYIYIEDMVNSLRGMIERGVYGLTLNLGSGVGHSLLDVVQVVQRVTGQDLDLVFKPGRAVDVPHLVLDVTRLMKMNLYQSRSLLEGVRDYAMHLGLANV